MKKSEIDNYNDLILQINNFFENKIIEKNYNFISLLKKIFFQYNKLSNMGTNVSCGQKILLNSNSFLYYPNKSKICFCNKKNVILFAHELSRTGAPMVVLDTAKVLLKNNYFVLVICPKSGPLLNDFLENGIPVLVEEDLLYVQYKKISTIYFSKYLAIDSIISQFDVSIFVSLTNYNIVKRYFNTQNKIIWWIHEGSESYKALVERIPENLPSNIQVYYGGDYSKNEAKSNGYFYPSEILNYGVVDEYKKKDKINSKKIIFLIAGTICIRKGQRIFLQAINLLNDSEMENCEFLFLGDCYDNDKTGIMVKNEIKEYSKKHKNIKFMESISRKELYKLYSKIDVLVVPSIDDPMPIVATENFMFKNICLCSDRTGTSYYMKDGYNGFIFKSQNYVELAQKLKYIIEHKFDLDFIRKNGRKTYETYFDMKIFEDKISKIIDEIN